MPRIRVPGGQDIRVTMSTATGADWSTNSTDWTLVRRFIFVGTDFTVALTTFHMIGYTSRADRTLSVKIVDVTNGGTTVCEVSGIDALSPTLYTTTQVSNLPVNAAIFEIQACRIGGNSGKVYVGENLLE